MALLYPIEGGYESQGFGPSNLGVEPAMYASGGRAWWNPFTGAKFYIDFHAAIDIAAPAGTKIVASETGTVIESYYDRTNGGGNKVRIQIRENVSYCSNHMLSRAVKVGDRVARGQVIGQVGSTGASTGNHNHWWVGLDDEVGSDTWPTLYNPKLFLPGGALANDPRIKPEDVKYVQLNGPGINIRTSADLDAGTGNVFATSRGDAAPDGSGIYRFGKKIAGINKRFVFLKALDTDDGRFLRVFQFEKILYIRREDVHFL